MINLDATDRLEGIASVADVVEFTCSVVDGTTVGSSEGKLGTVQTQIWAAAAATRVLSLTLVNTHTAAVTVNIQKDPTDAGVLYRVIPKDLSLGVGYMLVFDGQRCEVLTESGGLLKSAVDITLPVVDTTTLVKGSADGTKQVRIEADGLTTATTRVLTAPDKDITLVGTEDKLSAFSATTSAELAGVISDETGSGELVFGTAPTIYSRVTSKSALADLAATESGTVLVSASSGYNLTMPNAVGNTGLTFDFTKTDFNYNLITLRPKYRAVIEDCEDAWDESVDADVTSSADTADYKVGAASAKLVVAAGAVAGDILATEAIPAMDISGDHSVRLWIKCSVTTASGDLQLLLGEVANAATPAESLDIPALTADTWTEIDLTLASAAADRDAIISIGLKYVVDIGACDIRIDSVRAVAEKFNYPNDDGTTKTTYPKLNTGGAKATLVSDGSNWIVTKEDMGQVPSAKAYLSANQLNLENGTWTLINFDTKVYDIGNNFDTTTHKFTCPVLGYYLVSYTGWWEGSSVVANKVYTTTIYVDTTGWGENIKHAALAGHLTGEYTKIKRCPQNSTIFVKAKSGAGVDTVDIKGSHESYTSLEIELIRKE